MHHCLGGVLDYEPSVFKFGQYYNDTTQWPIKAFGADVAVNKTS